MTKTAPLIPVLRPRLPQAKALLPYLKRVDDNRWYTNYGPLLTELEQRLANTLHVQPAELATVSNGTVALTVAAG